jgi:hypothetical protein
VDVEKTERKRIRPPARAAATARKETVAMRARHIIGPGLVVAMLLAAAPALGQAPVITSIEPTSGPSTGGEPVTIRGENFVSAGVTGVTIGQPCINLNVVSDTEIHCTTVPVAEGVYVVILTPFAVNPAVTFTVIDTGPQVTSISPAGGTTETVVAVQGVNFTVDSTVVFENKVGGEQKAALNFAFVSSEEITCTPPSFPLATEAYIRVKNPSTALSPAVAASLFTYQLITPTIDDIDPRESNLKGQQMGAPVTITIDGKHFYPTAGPDGTRVNFHYPPGGDSPIAVTISNITVSADHLDDSIAALVPAAPASWTEGPITVEVVTPPGPYGKGDLFRYLDQPPYSVAVASPPAGAVVSGPAVPVLVNAQDDRAVTEVEVRWTDQNPGTTDWSLWTPIGTGTSGVTWDTTGIPDSTVVYLKAEARDGYTGGRIGDRLLLPAGDPDHRDAGTLSSPVQVTVDSGSSINPPVVNITSHVDDESVVGTVDITATVTHTVGIGSVTIYVDGWDVTSSATYTGDDLSRTYTYTWDSTAADDGPVEIRVEAYDSVPQLGRDIVTVIVGNVVDTDGDGLSDAYENQPEIETDPLIYDTDGDGLNDYYEVITVPALDGNNIDTDGDLMDDKWETDNMPWTDPLTPDADADPDMDDQNNLKEYRCKSDPGDAESVCPPPKDDGDCVPGKPNRTIIILLVAGGALLLGRSVKGRLRARARPE